MERLDLHATLESVLGSKNVYFQPPSTVLIKYPCIVYHRIPDYRRHANNKLYYKKIHYSVTVIDKNPTTTIPDRMSELPLTKFERTFMKDNLNHYVFTIYH